MGLLQRRRGRSALTDARPITWPTLRLGLHHFLMQDADFWHGTSLWCQRRSRLCCAIKARRAKLTGRLIRRCAVGGRPRDGLCSIYKSLECAILSRKSEPSAAWREARARLGTRCATVPSIRPYVEVTAMRWIGSPSCGWVVGEQAKDRLAKGGRVCRAGIGCRCENHQPWATVAES